MEIAIGVFVIEFVLLTFCIYKYKPLWNLMTYIESDLSAKYSEEISFDK